MRQYITYISYFLLSAISSGILYKLPGIFDFGNMVCWILTANFIFKTDKNIFFRAFSVLCAALAIVHLAADTVLYHSRLSHGSFYLFYDIPNYVLYIVIFSRMIDNALWMQNIKAQHRVLVLSTISLLIGLSMLCIIELYVSGAGGNGMLRYIICAPLFYFIMRYYGQKEKAG